MAIVGPLADSGEAGLACRSRPYELHWAGFRQSEGGVARCSQPSRRPGPRHPLSSRADEKCWMSLESLPARDSKARSLCLVLRAQAGQDRSLFPQRVKQLACTGRSSAGNLLFPASILWPCHRASSLGPPLRLCCPSRGCSSLPPSLPSVPTGKAYSPAGQPFSPGTFSYPGQHS